ncbi:MAG TPA: helix-turn-helix domain-containing protein [Victivallales bacterium]|nr:helix-turn-helix domain-containing protein [Victivallales bacterium]
MEWMEILCFRGTDVPVMVMRATHLDEMPEHSHDFTEFVLVMEGHAIHQIGEKKYKISTGNCFIIEPGMHHAYHKCHNLKLANILIRNSIMDKYGNLIRKDPAYSILTGQHKNKSLIPFLPPEDFGYCITLLTQLELEKKEMKESYSLIMMGILLELFARVFRAIQKTNIKKNNILTNISKALNYLETNFQKKISLIKLQDIAMLSERSFQRHFKMATGFSPGRYLLHLRIAHACRLLSESNKSIYEIADLCGFSNCNYFCRQFKQLTGYSPKKYADLKKLKISQSLAYNHSIHR